MQLVLKLFPIGQNMILNKSHAYHIEHDNKEDILKFLEEIEIRKVYAYSLQEYITDSSEIDYGSDEENYPHYNKLDIWWHDFESVIKFIDPNFKSA